MYLETFFKILSFKNWISIHTLKLRKIGSVFNQYELFDSITQKTKSALFIDFPLNVTMFLIFWKAHSCLLAIFSNTWKILFIRSILLRWWSTLFSMSSNKKQSTLKHNSYTSQFYHHYIQQIKCTTINRMLHNSNRTKELKCNQL